jgi:hypothetical protein
VNGTKFEISAFNFNGKKANLEFFRHPWKNVYDSRISWVTRETNGKTWKRSGKPGKIDHDFRISWVTQETNGKTWKRSGKPGNIDHDSRISSVTRETNGQTGNSSGKVAKFLEIAGNLKKSRRKF